MGLRTLLLPALLLLHTEPAASAPFVPDLSQGPVVFDFEDGLQGWTTLGSAMRVPTHALGGDWAIWGDGLAGLEEIEPDDPPSGVDGIVGDDPFYLSGSVTQIYLELDLTEIREMRIEQAPGSGDGASGEFLVFLEFFNLIPAILFEFFSPLAVPDPVGQPSLRTVDLSGHQGIQTIGIAWLPCQEGGFVAGSIVCSDPLPTEPGALTGFVDNVTFVPEPGRLLLWACASLFGLGIRLGSKKGGDASGDCSRTRAGARGRLRQADVDPERRRRL
jgi:hypothetical protein